MTKPKFGVTTDVTSSNRVSYDEGGIKKATLTDVVFEEIGKDTKYQVLSFKFLDAEGVKTFTHSEFAIDENDQNFEKKMNGMNSRIKHIWEAFKKELPTGGIGADAQSFDDFFRKVAAAFNTAGENNTPIYKDKDSKSKPVFIKVAYYSNKNNNVSFPLSPNFIEAMTTPVARTLTINLQYDRIKQPTPAQAPGQTHGGIHTGSGGGDDF
jgi:hypothetical protein